MNSQLELVSSLNKSFKINEMDNRREEIADLELALKLKASGFNWPVEFCYNIKTRELLNITPFSNFNELDNFTSTCTLSLIQKWLRDIHNIIVTPTTDYVAWEVEVDHPDWKDTLYFYKKKDKFFYNYEESLSYGIKIALDNLNNK